MQCPPELFCPVLFGGKYEMLWWGVILVALGRDFNIVIRYVLVARGQRIYRK